MAAVPVTAVAQEEDTTPTETTAQDIPTDQEETTSPEDTSGSQDDGTDSDTGSSDGPIAGASVSILEAIGKKVWDWVFNPLVDKISTYLKNSALTLPTDITGGSPIAKTYTSLAGHMRPGILVGILVLGILMMLRSPNYDAAYAGLTGLPRLVGAMALMAFLPQLMTMLAELSNDISATFFPENYQIQQAGYSVFQESIGASGLDSAGAGVFTIILGIMGLIVGALVVLTSILKDVFFMLLFLAAPFAIVGWIIPGLSPIVGSWFRGILACSAIPALWAIELGIGTMLINSPELIFGGSGSFDDSSVKAVLAILLLWLLYKTPFKVLEWAFQSYSPQGGTFRQLGRGMVFAAGTMAARGGIGKIAGAMGGGKPKESVTITETSQAGQRASDTGRMTSGGGGGGGGGVGGFQRTQSAEQTGQSGRSVTHSTTYPDKKSAQRDNPDIMGSHYNVINQNRQRGTGAPVSDNDNEGGNLPSQKGPGGPPQR